MNIEKKLIKFNTSSRKGTKIKYIVIHDTGNKNKGANAENHYKYFNGGNRNASAHYFVDDKKILQLVEDNMASWHCGDGKGRYGITNSNSIGIEICVNSDGDYNKAVNNTIELTKHLMKVHGIAQEDVVRHFDASTKICPMSMSSNGWRAWYEFKDNLTKVTTSDKKNDILLVNIKGKEVGLEYKFYNDKNYVELRKLAEELGHTVNYNPTTKKISIR